MIDNNYNDIFIRNASIAVLNLLQQETKIEQYDKGKFEEIQVNFMVSAGNSEQFMKDFFMGLPKDCTPAFIAEGNYETLPFGIIHMPPSVQINTKDLTNKFVRASFVEHETDENGKKNAVGKNGRLLALPMTITYSIDIKVANMNHLFKVWETLMNTFFQNKVVYFQYKGMRIQSQLRFPEVIDTKKNEQFDFSTADNDAMVSFKIEMETYYPCFDQSTVMNANNVIEQWNYTTKEKGSQQILGDRNGTFLDQDNRIE